MQKNEITISDIYRYLALSFRYPRTEWFDDTFLEVFFEISTKAGFTLEVEECEKVFTDPDWLETLQVEYTRLFVTSATGVVAAPFASIYIDGNGLLYDKFTEKIADYYREKGFELKDARYPPDYLIYQLEFMAVLVQDDPPGLEEFINLYFRQWFEIFSK